jgi:hypothetical protein
MNSLASTVFFEADQAGRGALEESTVGMDFVSDLLVDGRWFRILTVVDQYTRECLCAHADGSRIGEKVSAQLARVMRGGSGKIQLPTKIGWSIWFLIDPAVRAGATKARLAGRLAAL